MAVPKVFKSKTVDFNLIVPALAGLAAAMGLEIPENVVVGIMAIGNFILRLITKGPISDK
ncbi:MAG: hypothetical protein KAT70_07730 [Thermoplasmata archaeon]|nr:hypothetical protein [Thermoplasmata archaeon]